MFLVGTNRALLSNMTPEAKKADSSYAAFAARMLLALASEESDIARINGKFSAPVASQTLETVRPVK